jgi:glucokinase
MERNVLVGVDLGGTNIRAGRVETGLIVNIHEQAVSAQAAEEVVCREVMASISRVFTDKTQGIGVAVPSVVDPDRGIVYAVENIPSWQEVHLKEILEKEFGVPVSINNDANAFALGELYFGSGKGVSNLVGLTVGTALGAGIIIAGKLYNGNNCGAGEIGCIPYKEKTLEYHCSGTGMMHNYGIGGKELFLRASGGDESALSILHKFGKIMGDAIAIVILAYDPEMIVIGGSVSRSFSFFEPGMWERLASFPYQNSLKKLRIEPTLDTRIPVLGAAALHLDTLKK